MWKYEIGEVATNACSRNNGFSKTKGKSVNVMSFAAPKQACC